MLRRTVVAIGVVVGGLALAPLHPAGAVAPNGELPCPDGYELVIAADVVLTDDVTCAHARWVLAPGVTVDLGGHVVTDTDPRECGAFFDSCTFDVGGGALRNGRIDGASVSIGGGGIDHLHVVGGRVGVTGRAYPWRQPAEPGGSITTSVVHGGGVALWIGAELSSSWVIGGGGVDLVNSDHTLAELRVTDNLIVNSSRWGIGNAGRVHFDDDVSGVISGNIVAWSAFGGIELVGVVTSLGAVEVSNNVVMGNIGSGIHVGGTDPWRPRVGGPVTLTGNTALFNRGHGIDAFAATDGTVDVVDGGGNHAIFNALNPCVGVTCS